MVFRRAKSTWSCDKEPANGYFTASDSSTPQTLEPLVQAEILKIWVWIQLGVSACGWPRCRRDRHQGREGQGPVEQTTCCDRSANSCNGGKATPLLLGGANVLPKENPIWNISARTATASHDCSIPCQPALFTRWRPPTRPLPGAQADKPRPATAHGAVRATTTNSPRRLTKAQRGPGVQEFR